MFSRTPCAMAASARRSASRGWPTASMTVESFRASATIRAIFPGSMIGEVRSTPVMPAATIASASGTVATETPRAPAANWRRATSGHLCVLACGRSAQPLRRQCSAIFSILA